MKKRNALWMVVAAVVVVALIVAGILVSGRHSNPSNYPNIPYTGSSNPSQSSQSSQLFSASPYYQYAYQIFPGPLSSTSQEAIAGFNVSEQNNSDGSITINLVATNPNFPRLSYKVTQGDAVYFIETNFGEDSPTADYDGLYLDDMVVVVNSSGYITQGPGQA